MFQAKPKSTVETLTFEPLPPPVQEQKHEDPNEKLQESINKHLADYGLNVDLRVNDKGVVEVKRLFRSVANGVATEGEFYAPLERQVKINGQGIPVIDIERQDVNNKPVVIVISLADYFKPHQRLLVEKLPENAFKLAREYVDFNKDRFLTTDEFEKAYQNEGLKGQHSQIVTTLGIFADKIENLSNDSWGPESGVTKQDVKKLSSVKDDRLRLYVESHLSNTATSLNNRPISLYGLKGYPSPYDGRQYILGNCYLVAALHAIAAARPEEIQRRIQPLPGDKGYHVSFHGANVDVPVPTQSELTTYSVCNEGGGYWMAVLIKAYGECRGENFIFKKGASEKYTDGGGFSRYPMMAMTGLKTDEIKTATLSEDELHKMLEDATRDRKAYCFSTALFTRRAQVGFMNIHPQHAYAGLTYNPQTRLVSIIEPRRGDSNFDDPRTGTANLTLAQVKEIFASIEIETQKPPSAPKEADKSKVGFPQVIRAELK